MTTQEALPYALTQGEEVFDWNEFLTRPRRDMTTWMQASMQARKWVTCACGNQCAIIPRDDIGSPYDDELQTLGVRFTGLIGRWRRKDAWNVLQQIERRSAQLIHQLTKSAA